MMWIPLWPNAWSSRQIHQLVQLAYFNVDCFGVKYITLNGKSPAFLGQCDILAESRELLGVSCSDQCQFKPFSWFS